MNVPKSQIVGTGSYVPEKVLTNADLERLVETSDQWIVERTGIRERRVAADEASSDMARRQPARAGDGRGQARAARPHHRGNHLARHAAALLRRLSAGQAGGGNAAAFDVAAACAGSLYAMSIADRFIVSGTVQADPGGRGRAADPPDGLDRPQHLRPLWRRRRGHGAGPERRRPRGSPLDPPSHRRQAGGNPLHSWRAAPACQPPRRPSSRRLHFVKMNGREVYKSRCAASPSAWGGAGRKPLSPRGLAARHHPPGQPPYPRGGDGALRDSDGESAG
jgi:3-oxoacyl-[acyl-carrier-protein] synthase-3